MRELFGNDRPLIGVVHLQPLPGAPGYGGDREAVRRRAVDDARSLASGGVDGLLLENYGDAPYLPGGVPPHAVASLTALTAAVGGAVDLPLGVNVLRNDPGAALAVADAVGGAFVRANVWTGARLTDQGLIQGRAHDVLRQRGVLDSRVRVFADVQVKHSAGLADRPLEAEVEETLRRGGADAVIVTGPATGRPANVDRIDRARAAAAGAPVLVGSGVTPDNVAALLERCDGAIVGTALERGGVTGAPVDPDRVDALVAAARAADVESSEGAADGP